MLVECNPLMALRTMLATAHAASEEEAKLEMRAYEFFEQACTLYEEAVADSRMRVVALQAIIGTLHSCYVFGPENRDALVQNATGYSAKLLKRSDRCKAVCACSHLAWQADLPAAAAGSKTARRAAGSSSGDGSGTQAPVGDAAKVMTCLKRALKVANSAKQQASPWIPPSTFRPAPEVSPTLSNANVSYNLLPKGHKITARRHPAQPLENTFAMQL